MSPRIEIKIRGPVYAGPPCAQGFVCPLRYKGEFQVVARDYREVLDAWDEWQFSGDRLYNGREYPRRTIHGSFIVDRIMDAMFGDLHRDDPHRYAAVRGAMSKYKKSLGIFGI